MSSRKYNKSNASELISFHYDRPTNVSNSPITKRRTKPRSNSLTKSQYVCANFKFLISPFCDPKEPALYSPDCLIPWDSVDVVVVPRFSGESQVCSICLDDSRISRITKCGHIYCYTCIIRHLTSDLANHKKCPVCSEYLSINDLRLVDFPHCKSTTSANFEEPESPTPEDSLPTLQYQHMHLAPGSIFPHVYHDTIDSYSVAEANNRSKTLVLSDVVPEAGSLDSVHSRVVTSSVGSMRERLLKERGALLQWRQQCLVEHSDPFGPGDVEALPYIGLALDILGKVEEEFEGKVRGFKGQKAGSRSLRNNPPLDQLSKSLTNKQLGHQQGVNKSNSGTNELLFTPEKPLKTTQESSSLDQITPSTASIEKMETTTSIVEHEESNDVCNAPNCKSNMEVESRPGSIVTPVTTPVGIQSVEDWHRMLDQSSASNNSTDNKTKAVSSMNNDFSELKKRLYGSHFYQCSLGQSVYLHPLCTRCLLECVGGDPEALPSVLEGLKVLEVETVRLTEAVRQRLNSAMLPLQQMLPLYSEIRLVEVDMSGLAPPEVMVKFRSEIEKREKRRKERKKLQKKEDKIYAEKKVMEEVLLQERFIYIQDQREKELESIRELLNGPDLSQAYSVSGPAVGSENKSKNSRKEKDSDVKNEGESSNTHSSFAKITQMGGHFPELGEKKKNSEKPENSWPALGNTSKNKKAINGHYQDNKSSKNAIIDSDGLNEGSNNKNNSSAWGTSEMPKEALNSPAKNENKNNPTPSAGRNKGFGKKNKISLLSTTSSRRYY